jgi:hypothetical protein
MFRRNWEQLHKNTLTRGTFCGPLDVWKTKRRVLEDFGQRREGQCARSQTSAAARLKTSRLSHRIAVLGDLYDRKSNGCDQKHCAKLCLQAAKQADIAASEFVICRSEAARAHGVPACWACMLRLMSTMHPRIDPLRGMVSSSYCCTSHAFCANLSALFLLNCCIEFGGLIGGDGKGCLLAHGERRLVRVMSDISGSWRASWAIVSGGVGGKAALH